MSATGRSLLSMLQPGAPLRTSGPDGFNIERQRLNDMQGSEVPLNNGMRWAKTIAGGDDYPEIADSPNMYKFRWVQFKHGDGDDNAVGDSDVESVELSEAKDYDGYVYNVATLDPYAAGAYIPEGSDIWVLDHSNFLLTWYVTPVQMAFVKIPDAGIAAATDDGATPSVTACKKYIQDENAKLVIDLDDELAEVEIDVLHYGAAIEGAADHEFKYMQLKLSPGGWVIDVEYCDAS